MLKISEWKKSRYEDQVIQWSFFRSSIGYCLVAWLDEGICSLSIHALKNHRKEAFGDLQKRFPKMKLQEQKVCPFQAAVDEALSGKVSETPVPVILKGTPFQIRVWKVLSKVPASKLTTYKELAEKAGSPKGFRAVGSAVGANPIGVLIPCHRVLRSDKGIGGFRWGLNAKKALLAKEGHNAVFY